MKKELKLKKSCKHIVLNIDLQQNPYTSLLDTTIKSVKWVMDENLFIKMILHLDDVTILDENQIETFISDVKAHVNINYDLDTNEIIELDIDDIDYQAEKTNDRRINQFLLNNVEELLSKSIIFEILSINPL